MRKVQEFKEFFALGTKQHLHRNDLRQDEYIIILYSLDKSLAINGINLRQEYRREQWRKCSICWWYTQKDVKQMR